MLVTTAGEIKVPKGGGTITRFRVTPKEVGPWFIEVLNESGFWEDVNNTIVVLFPYDSVPSSEDVMNESATLVVTMSDEAVDEKWTFANYINICSEDSLGDGHPVKITKSITTNFLNWVFDFTDKSHGRYFEQINYSYVALRNDKCYIQDDPAIIIGRPSTPA